MRKLVFVFSVSVFSLLAPSGVQAFPVFPQHTFSGSAADLVEIKGGHGHGWGRGHNHKAFGWSRGRKVGWRGHHCPPGHWKKGWC